MGEKRVSGELDTAEQQSKKNKVDSNNGNKPYQVSEVIQIEHAITNLTSCLRRIIDVSPSLDEYKEKCKLNYENEPEILPALSRYKLKLAAELKQLYCDGKLPIVDDIQNYGNTFNALDKSSAAQLNSNTSNVGLKPFKEDTVFVSSVKTVSGDGNSWPPALPEIQNPAIKARVFIHKSVINDKLYLSDGEMISAHNERLEFLGDSILNSIVTAIIYKRFPSYSEGQLSQLRVKLISNERLREWSLLYKLNESLKTISDTVGTLGKQKLYADVFEAYIGGLIEDFPSNFQVIQDWLEKLAEPILSSQKMEEKLDVNAKRELYSLIGYASLGLSYQTIQVPTEKEPFAIVECRIADGTILGVGRGKNSKIAGLAAATNVMNDKALIQKYAAQRAAIPRDVSVLKGSKETTKYVPRDKQR